MVDKNKLSIELSRRRYTEFLSGSDRASLVALYGAIRSQVIITFSLLLGEKVDFYCPFFPISQLRRLGLNSVNYVDYASNERILLLEVLLVQKPYLTIDNLLVFGVLLRPSKCCDS